MGSFHLGPFKFTLPHLYLPGHTLTQDEAQALNWLRLQRIKEATRRYATRKGLNISKLRLAELDSLQAKVDELAKTFQFPSNSMARQSHGLYERLLTEIAEEKAIEAIGLGTKPEEIQKLALCLRDRSDVICEAKARLAEARAMAEEELAMIFGGESQGAGATLRNISRTCPDPAQSAATAALTKITKGDGR